MNGKVVTDATTPARGATLTAITETPLMDTSDRIEALYLATLSRPPTPQELDQLLLFVGKKAKTPESERLADILWMLLNSAEFRLNH